MEKVHDFDGVFDAQAVFRLVLQAMANPLTSVDLSPFAEKFSAADFRSPDFLALGMTLLDNEVSFCTSGSPGLMEALRDLSLSRPESVPRADFVFVEDPSLLKSLLEQVKCGTLENPHASATLIVRVQDGPSKTLRLQGPGIAGTLEKTLSRTVTDVLTLRDHQFYEYPTGVDFLFVDERAQLCAVPRLVKKVVL